MLVDFTMNNQTATGSYQRRSPSPKPIQKTPSWTVSQHEDDGGLGLAVHDSLDVAQQEPSSLSPLDAYDNASPQGSHFSGAMSLFGSHSDLTTPGYGDDFLGEAIGPMLTLNYNDDAPTPPRTTATQVYNDPAPVRQGLDPEQRPAVEATSIDELEKMRALDATKSEVRNWLHTTETATDKEVAESDRLRVATLTKRQRAKSTGDANNRRIPELHSSPKPVATLSPEAYLNFDDDDDEDDNNNDEDDGENDGQDDDDEEDENGANQDEDDDGTATDQNDFNRTQRSSTPPVRAESLEQSGLVASPPPLQGHETNDASTAASRGKPWADPDFALPIRTPSQPHTSSAAMAMFQQRARDIETASVSATIGSRRRSETDVSSLFSAAGISVKVPAPSSRVPVTETNTQRQRRPSLLSKVLPRRSSSNLKKRKDGEASPPLNDAPANESTFAPPKRITSWGRAKSPARIDVSAPSGPMRSPPGSGGGNNNGSASLGTPTAWQTAKAAVRRGRSPSGGGLADMLRQAGGPPVAHLPQTDDTACPKIGPSEAKDDPLLLDTAAHNNMDDDDFDQGFFSTASATTAVPEAATHAAFKEHILKLDSRDIMPHFMIERLAQEQVKRYRRLADSFQRHKDASKCSAGALCSKKNPAPRFLPPKSVPKGAAAGGKSAESAPVVFYVSSSPQTLDELNSLDSSAVAATFPAGVPLPPVPRLPAEFECPLCFQVKKIYKPSDWTKHVHEDVQPFTCTFPNCAETKSFKRKADWVRHENERHRHLEKWECSINSCGHQCFRKNNFQEHLVREHKLPEIRERRPTATSVATNAPESSVIMDLIESCHVETTKQPTDEPCRFCSERCTTWKKLHVHLAAHLLSISMPILEMQGLGDIKLPPPHSASVKQNAQLLSDNEDGSQNSFSRNISSSPSATRSPALPFGADYNSRAVNTYPPPAMAYTGNQYQLASQQQSSSFNYSPDQHHEDTIQDPSFLTTPVHTYPPPGVGRPRSRSATRSPTESWLNQDYTVTSGDLTPTNLAMQGQLGVSGPPAQQQQQAQGMVYSQSGQGFPTPQTDQNFFQSSPPFTSSTPQLGMAADFPTPVSHPRSQAQSQSQSRLVSPTPQHNAVTSGMHAIHGMAYAPNGTAAATYPNGTTTANYPNRTTTADDVANNIQIVRRQLALEQRQQQQQQQPRRRDAQVASQQQQQQQQSMQQQQGFFAEPLEADFSSSYGNQQENDWLNQMYSAQQNQQQQQGHGQQQQQQYNNMMQQQQHQLQQQHQHQQPHSGLGAQIPYTSAPGGW